MIREFVDPLCDCSYQHTQANATWGPRWARLDWVQLLQQPVYQVEVLRLASMLSGPAYFFKTVEAANMLVRTLRKWVPTHSHRELAHTYQLEGGSFDFASGVPAWAVHFVTGVRPPPVVKQEAVVDFRELIFGRRRPFGAT